MSIVTLFLLFFGLSSYSSHKSFSQPVVLYLLTHLGALRHINDIDNVPKLKTTLDKTSSKLCRNTDKASRKKLERYGLQSKDPKFKVG